MSRNNISDQLKDNITGARKKVEKSARAFVAKRFEWVQIYLNKNPFLAAIIFIVLSWFTNAVIVFYAEQDAKDHNINSIADAIWWGIVTLSTVGYGDKYPVTHTGRIFAGLLIVCGVVGIAIITAKISSYFLERALRERRGIVDTATLNRHFIICGWKDQMATLLMQILDANPQLPPEQIVMLNSASDSDIQEIHDNPRLKKIKVIHGDFWLEMNLRRSAPERAFKILILADATRNAKGEIPTITEADARTVMTAMTLSNIAKGTPVMAEILDSAMDQYLRLAHVHEIVYSRDYSRLLLATASTGTGVSNVIHDLLNPRSPVFLSTKNIPSDVIHQNYDQLISVFREQHPDMTVIGILENSGNSHQAKETAIKKAQQTANVAQLVQNLHTVKQMRFNRPIFNPKGDYVIGEGSMAIVVETRAVNGVE